MKHLTLPFTALLAALGAQAQTTTLGSVTVTGRSDPSADVAGWGDVPLSKLPLQASIVTREQMRERGVQRLSDVIRIDPAASDAYNAEGYWDSLTVRGFVIDNRSNYRRDGLPINAETSISLDNKERIEILKGTSGMQAGTSAPGGLVNLVVKRPASEPIREAQLGWRSANSLLAAVDIGQRFGAGDAFGLRVNAAAEHLDPRVRDATGERHLLAIAADWRVGADALLEAEVESSHRRQPSVPGFSMLGSAVPSPVDPRINLNNQPWTLPVVFDGTTASLRFTQRLSPAWRWSLHAATQRLRTDDRIAFPFGCGAEGNFDRYCSDGTFDLYDYRSENERRRSDALEWALHGTLSSGALTHRASVGVLRSRFQARFQEQAFNFVGTGNVDGTLATSPDPTLAPGSANRGEDSTELFARDAVQLGATTAWLGLRHTRLARGYAQTFTTPWLALSHELANATMAYASWGQGIESVLTPCLLTYGSAACQPLPAQRSRQAEIGLKRSGATTSWTLAWFDIDQPATTDTGTAFFVDGHHRRRGVEAGAAWQASPWTLQGGVQFLRARREGSEDASQNGLRPTNLPARTLKLQARRELAAVPGLALQADLLAESNRIVLPDNSARIPGYARLDASVHRTLLIGQRRLTWRAGIDNLLDRRAWRESPYQFGHVYLFPLAARTLHLTAELAL